MNEQYTPVREIEAVQREADCLFSAAEVEAALDKMAEELNERLAAANPVVLATMIGGVVIAGQLLPRLRFPLSLDYVHVTRYRGATRGGELHWIRRPPKLIQGRTVLILDDVLDEAHTLGAIQQACRDAGATEIVTAVLVEKAVARSTQHDSVDVVGLKADNRYLFGYGMDYKHYLRNAPGIYAVKGS